MLNSTGEVFGRTSCLLKVSWARNPRGAPCVAGPLAWARPGHVAVEPPRISAVVITMWVDTTSAVRAGRADYGEKARDDFPTCQTGVADNAVFSHAGCERVAFSPFPRDPEDTERGAIRWMAPPKLYRQAAWSAMASARMSVANTAMVGTTMLPTEAPTPPSIVAFWGERLIAHTATGSCLTNLVRPSPPPSCMAATGISKTVHPFVSGGVLQLRVGPLD